MIAPHDIVREGVFEGRLYVERAYYKDRRLIALTLSFLDDVREAFETSYDGLIIAQGDPNPKEPQVSMRKEPKQMPGLYYECCGELFYLGS